MTHEVRRGRPASKDLFVERYDAFSEIARELATTVQLTTDDPEGSENRRKELIERLKATAGGNTIAGRFFNSRQTARQVLLDLHEERLPRVVPQLPPHLLRR